MKNLIVNIYKTLFFFDLSIVIAYYIPDISTENAALLDLWQNGIFLAVMIIFTAVFLKFAEHGTLKVFNTKNKLRHYSIGLLTAVIPLGITVAALWLLKMLTFSGTGEAEHIILRLLSLLFNVIATELLLRGYLFRLYRKYYSIPVTTAVITALFISLNLYMLSDGVIYTVNMLIMNISLCLIAEYTRSVLAPVTAHFIYNAVSSLVFGSFEASETFLPLLDTVFSGKSHISGGDMKLEGSVIMLGVNLAVCIYFAVRLYKRNGYKIRNKQTRRRSVY